MSSSYTLITLDQSYQSAHNSPVAVIMLWCHMRQTVPLILMGSTARPGFKIAWIGTSDSAQSKLAPANQITALIILISLGVFPCDNRVQDRTSVRLGFRSGVYNGQSVSQQQATQATGRNEHGKTPRTPCTEPILTVLYRSSDRLQDTRVIWESVLSYFSGFPRGQSSGSQRFLRSLNAEQ